MRTADTFVSDIYRGRWADAPIKILVIASPSTTRHLMVLALQVEGCVVQAANDRQVARSIMEKLQPDLVIIVPSPELQARDCLREQFPLVPALVVVENASRIPPHHGPRPLKFIEMPVTRRCLIDAVQELVEPGPAGERSATTSAIAPHWVSSRS